MNAFSEEEIRSNIIIPLLKDIGFSYNDLKLETTFKIQLGRGIYDVKNEEKEFIGGRLDILCKADNKNLFLIELKAENVEIDKEKDLYQALSYARLLQPMPPYVILSNGQTTYIFDVVSSLEVNKNHLLKNGFSVNIADETTFRFNVLKHFIGYSFENLISFCNGFNSVHLNFFCANGQDPVESQLKKKYIPDLYVNRKPIKIEFDKFISQQEMCVFAIIGESGSGKTNEIIDLLLNHTDGPALFYSGTLLGMSFFDELKFDFNLEFSPQESELSLLKKISSLSESYRKCFIIYIDAIDEWVAYDKVKQLDELVKVASRYNFKLCISCKDLMWSSFLNNNGLSTYLSSKLFTAPLGNFEEDEFNMAVVKYSNVLQTPTKSERPSSSFRNPFSMRVAFEVSFAENHLLDLNSLSENIIESYINQKITKFQFPERAKRYLLEISKALLEQDKVHEDEDVLRRYIHLGINEDIPIDLFSNNLLYRNNIENANYIGFYFSIIRDHIIARDILKIKDQVKGNHKGTILKNLRSYVGENAINYYFKNTDVEGKRYCLEAFSKYDNETDQNKFTKLLAQQGNDFYESLNDEVAKEIIHELKLVILHRDNELNRDAEIIEIITKLSIYFDIELEIIDVLRVLNKSAHGFDISPELCRILAQYTSPEGTDELIRILTDDQFSNRIRRFVIDALGSRDFDCRKEILLGLLNETIQGKEGVYFYSIYWYNYIEDADLRDKMLYLFDNERDKIKDDVLRTLATSEISDTGRLLFQRFTENKYSEHITCWLCRAICDQKYKPAVKTFIELFKTNPDSDLAGHILIGLGEIKAEEFMPSLLDVIENLKDDYKNRVWLPHAFAPIATASDFDYLYELGKKSKNTPTILFSAETLSESRNPKYYDLIVDTINNMSINIHNRYGILRAWETNLCSEDSEGGIKVMKFIQKNADGIGRIELNKIYETFERNDEMSPIALSILINFEVDIELLSKKLIRILPNLSIRLNLNQITLVNWENLKKLALKLDFWLSQQLLKKSWSNPIYLFNCLQIAGAFGQSSVLDSIESNKYIFINALSKVLENDSALNYLNAIAHNIRASNNNVRTRLTI